MQNNPSKSAEAAIPENPGYTWHRVRAVTQHCFLSTIALVLLMIPSGLCSQQQIVPIVQAVVSIPVPPAVIPEPAPPLEDPALSASQDRALTEEPDHRPFHAFIIEAARTYQVDPALIQAIIMAESNNDPRAVSHRGARGLMQLMPRTAKWLGVEDSFDPAMNIDGGVRYFRHLLDRFKGDVRLALAAYNAGSLYVHKYGGVPPFKDTRAYIKKVLEFHQRYQREMATHGSNSSSV